MSDEENHAILNEQMKLEGEEGSIESVKSINKNCEVKWPVKRKIDKILYRRRRNARIHRLVLPKSALVVFSELFRNVPIQIEEHQLWNGKIYTATIEIDGQRYTANNISKTEAKHKACENLFRSMLFRQITMQSEEKQYPEEIGMEDGKNGTAPKLMQIPQEDFPWPHFASFAMHKLINQWSLQPDSNNINLQDQRPNGVQLPPKVAASTQMFPVDPSQYQPVCLLAQLRPEIKFTYTILHPIIQANCVIDRIPFVGIGSSKKSAKKECCIMAIKYLWNFDFHTID